MHDEPTNRLYHLHCASVEGRCVRVRCASVEGRCVRVLCASIEGRCKELLTISCIVFSCGLTNLTPSLTPQHPCPSFVNIPYRIPLQRLDKDKEEQFAHARYVTTMVVRISCSWVYIALTNVTPKRILWNVTLEYLIYEVVTMTNHVLRSTRLFCSHSIVICYWWI